MSGESIMENGSLEERFLAHGLQLPEEDLGPLAELVAGLKDAAKAVRAPAPQPDPAEPATVLILPRKP